MNNYLLQLLKEVKTLIIPGLGALTVTNEATGEIMFMPYLKYDDGTLAQHIANKEGMEVNDAKNLIAKFVRDVTVALDKGDSYDMYEFGSFKKIEGEIAFEKWGSDSVSSSATTDTKNPEPELVVPIAAETEPEVIAEPEPIVEIQNDPIPEHMVQEEKPEVVEETIEPEQVVDVEPIVSAPIVEEKTVEPIKEETPVVPIIEKTSPKVEEKAIPETKEAPVPVVEAPKTKNKKEEKPAPKKVGKAPKEKGPKKKMSVLSYILWGVFVLILGSGAYVFINYDDLKYDFPILADLAGEKLKPIASEDSSTTILEDEPAMNIDTETPSEPLPDEEIEGIDESAEAAPETKPEKVIAPKPAPKKVETPVKKETPKPVVKPVKKTTPAPKADGSLPYHIIAGSFGSETNANRLANSLQSKGYSSASVMQNNGMYRVSVKGFSTLSEATNEAKNMQGDVPGAWVLKK